MNPETRPSPRRVILTVLFVLWLGIEAAVIGLSPAWGFILPHEHITRGILTQSDWQRHLQEHLRAEYPVAVVPCDTPHSNSPAVIASIPDLAGAFSLFSVFAMHLDNAQIKLSNLDTFLAALDPSPFFVFDVGYTPLHPPPNS